MTEWKNRIIGHGSESPDNLLAHPLNHRIHTRPQQEALGTVLDAVGVVQSVIVNQRTGFVVDGHLRISLAMRSGQKTIPVVYVDLSDEEESIVLASLDAIGAMAVEDKAMMHELIESIETEDAEIIKMLAACVASETIPEITEFEQEKERTPITCPQCGASW